MMNLCTYMPSSLTQVHTHSHTQSQVPSCFFNIVFKCQSGLIRFKNVEFDLVLDFSIVTAYVERVWFLSCILVPPSPSLHVFSFNFSPPSSIHLHVSAVSLSSCSSILYFFHSITFTVFLFFLFLSSSFHPHLSCHSVTFSSLLSHVHILCSAFFLLLASHPPHFAPAHVFLSFPFFLLLSSLHPPLPCWMNCHAG